MLRAALWRSRVLRPHAACPAWLCGAGAPFFRVVVATLGAVPIVPGVVPIVLAAVLIVAGVVPIVPGAVPIVPADFP